MSRKWFAQQLALNLALAAAIPMVANRLRDRSLPRCHLDGQPIVPVFRVQVLGGAGQSWSFCCIRCAELWLDGRQGEALGILITDEVSGREVDASLAFFVRSSVVTTPSTGNRIHAFARRADAENHAARFHGTLLHDRDRPFRAGEEAIRGSGVRGQGREESGCRPTNRIRERFVFSRGSQSLARSCISFVRRRVPPEP